MFTTIAFALLIIWFLGVIGLYTLGWFIHVFLIVAIILFLIRIIFGEHAFSFKK